MGGASVVTFRIETVEEDLRRLRKALKLLGDQDAPFLTGAMDDVRRELIANIAGRAPGSMAAKVRAVGAPTGKNGAIRARGVVAHPGAKSMEFGRGWYYTGFSRPGPYKNGRRVMRPGQKPKPFVGIVEGGHAIGATAAYANEAIVRAIKLEWERVSGA